MAKQSERSMPLGIAERLRREAPSLLPHPRISTREWHTQHAAVAFLAAAFTFEHTRKAAAAWL
jgi:hypothetical protein